MKILLDTQILLWSVARSEHLSEQARQLITDKENEIYFSPASLWEVTIKNSLNHPDFQVDARISRRRPLNSDYHEIAITGLHATAVGDLPPLHKDPFDRLLLAQAKAEGLSLLTTNAALSAYPAPVLQVRKSG
ncbi:MAG: type II toxin-antitoxin system VapC family toxin [Deltaproteobacteria bacterium]|jgi:PIN domain nuclease of toxin-antitoxin system|nr:type II toxin-antitoxin system VapC family toxin [Deltaproteobacteria bacterium]